MTPSEEYTNKQYNDDVPSVLDGVMKRWVVPEGEEDRKEPVVMQIQVSQEVVEDTVKQSVPPPPLPINKTPKWVYWTIFLFAVSLGLLTLNLYIMFISKFGP